MGRTDFQEIDNGLFVPEKLYSKDYPFPVDVVWRQVQSGPDKLSLYCKAVYLLCYASVKSRQVVIHFLTGFQWVEVSQ